MSIKENIEEIKRDIKKYKTVDDVLLLAVTKTKPVEDILEAIDAGITDIGENKVQEIQEKYDQVKDKVKIHMIGHLQTNKVKYIVGKVELIHSLDRKSLADEINKRAKKLGIIQNCLLQVNVTKEESKFGCYIENLDSLLEYCNNLENIKIIGLMGMAPFFDNPEDARDNFKKLKELFEKYKNRGYNNITMDKLSMGMSHDYIIALEEGSNLVELAQKYLEKDFIREDKMGIFDKLKKSIGLEEYYDEDYDYEDNKVESGSSRPEKIENEIEEIKTIPKRGNIVNLQTNQVDKTKINIHEPITYDDGPAIIDDIVAKKVVVLNLEMLELEKKKQIFEFILGGIYALKGQVQKSQKTFLF